MALSPYYEPTEGGDTTFEIEATKIKFGNGALGEIGFDARALGMSRVALFTDPRVAKLEPLGVAVKALRDAGMEVVIYDQVEVEPTDASFKAGTEFALDGKFDGFVSVGGGSVMDTCKAANLYSSHPPGDFLDYVNPPIGGGKRAPGPIKPHIACPTTFGTASECTGLAIFDLLEMNAKTGVSNAQIKPSIGVVDPDNLKSLPQTVKAANGLDVFSHAVESLTARPFTRRAAPEDPSKRPLSQGANPYSDINCLRAIELIGKYLVPSVQDPDDLSIYEPLMFAGMLAGIGFGSAGCNLPHGMSYAVAGLVKDFRAPGWPQDHPMVPHGYAVIVNSPSVFRFTGHFCPERHLMAAQALGAETEGVNKEPGDILADRVIGIMRDTGMPNGLSGVGYGEADVPALTEKSWPQKRLIDNAPGVISKQDLEDMFRGAVRYW